MENTEKTIMENIKSTKEVFKGFDKESAKLEAKEDGEIIIKDKDGKKLSLELMINKKYAEDEIKKVSKNALNIISTFIDMGENIKVHYTNSNKNYIEFFITKVFYPNGLLWVEDTDEVESALDFAVTLDKLGETVETAIER